MIQIAKVKRVCVQGTVDVRLVKCVFGKYYVSFDMRRVGMCGELGRNSNNKKFKP